jgi:hypothetical protein
MRDLPKWQRSFCSSSRTPMRDLPSWERNNK